MNKKRIFVSFLAILSCTVCISAQLTRVATKTDKLDFGVGGTVAIIGAPKGSIRVEASSRNEIEITAEIMLQAPTESDLATLEHVTSYVLDESLGRVAITSVGTHDSKYLKRVAKKFPKTLMGLPSSINYVVKVPHYCDLQIDNGIGDVSVIGIEGNLRINSLESNTRLDLVGGGVNATFQKGNVSITMPNRSWRGDAIDVALASGNMDVYMPVTLSAELDATILKTGKIENELIDLKPRIRTVKFTEQSISAKAGSGGVPMKFTVGDGTLRLKTIGKSQ